MAQGALRNYSLQQVIITLNALPVEGFGPDDAISFEPSSEEFTKSVGADGEVTRSQTSDLSGMFTLTLMQTSLSNDALKAFLNIARSIGVGDIFTISITDLNSGENLFAENCWIERVPDFAFGKEASTREWQIAAAKVSIT